MILATKIPFEIHLTTRLINQSDEASFVQCCEAYKAKPLMIELARGETRHQPMLSKIVYADDVGEVMNMAKQLALQLLHKSFRITRIKIEVPAKNSMLLQEYTSTVDNYFEWHGKVVYKEPNKLERLCKKHQVHLSRNSLKNESNTRFVTLREFGTQTDFDNRVTPLISNLQQHGWLVLKQQSEYCIYDDNTLLDKGWLS